MNDYFGNDNLSIGTLLSLNPEKNEIKIEDIFNSKCLLEKRPWYVTKPKKFNPFEDLFSDKVNNQELPFFEDFITEKDSPLFPKKKICLDKVYFPNDQKNDKSFFNSSNKEDKTLKKLERINSILNNNIFIDKIYCFQYSNKTNCSIFQRKKTVLQQKKTNKDFQILEKNYIPDSDDIDKIGFLGFEKSINREYKFFSIQKNLKYFYKKINRYNFKIKFLINSSKENKLYLLERLPKNKKENNICVICLSDTKGYWVKTLCKHKFHQKCLNKWLRKKRSTCPYCRMCLLKRKRFIKFIETTF